MDVDLPPIQFTGRIHLIQSDGELQDALKILRSATELGFDTETRPSFRKGEFHPVSLLQLSTSSDAYLVRLLKIQDPKPLREIFERSDILKIGLAIHDDLRLLKKSFPFEPRSFLELQTLAKEKGLKNMGLKTLTAEVLQSRLSKGNKLTNWEAESLTPQQLLYAATDAWIGLKLYRAMRSI